MEIEYDLWGRMKYNAELHENHSKHYVEEELIYICSMWDFSLTADIGLAIGKTQTAVRQKVYCLRKNGLFDKYRKMGITSRSFNLY